MISCKAIQLGETFKGERDGWIRVEYGRWQNKLISLQSLLVLFIAPSRHPKFKLRRDCKEP